MPWNILADIIKLSVTAYCWVYITNGWIVERSVSGTPRQWPSVKRSMSFDVGLSDVLTSIVQPHWFTQSTLVSSLEPLLSLSLNVLHFRCLGDPDPSWSGNSWPPNIHWWPINRLDIWIFGFWNIRNWLFVIFRHITSKNKTISDANSQQGQLDIKLCTLVISHKYVWR